MDKPLPHRNAEASYRAIRELEKDAPQERINDLIASIGASGFPRSVWGGMPAAFKKRLGGEVAEYKSRIQEAIKLYGVETEASGDLSIDAYNKKYAVVTTDSMVRVMLLPATTEDGYRLLRVPDFMVHTAPDRITVETSDGGEKMVPFATQWLNSHDRMHYAGGIEFDPSKTRKELFETRKAYNIFDGFAVPTFKEDPGGSWCLLEDHLRNNVCRGDESYYSFVMTWFADIIQHPGEKKGSAFGLRGRKGVGKSKIAEWFREVIGLRHSVKVSKKSDLVGNFNAHQAYCIFLVCEEAFWAGDHEAKQVLKDLITAQRLLLEKKNVDKVEINNCMRLMFISNEAWFLPCEGEDERRFFVLECGESRRGDKDYFANIDKQMKGGGLKAWAYALQHWDPAEHGMTWDDLRTPPQTPWGKQQAMNGNDVTASFFAEAVETGALPWEDKILPDPGIVKLSETEGVWIHLPTFREYFKSFLLNSTTKPEARRVLRDLNEVVRDHLGDVPRNVMLAKCQGRKDREKGRAVWFPPLVELRAKLVKAGVTAALSEEEEETVVEPPSLVCEWPVNHANDDDVTRTLRAFGVPLLLTIGGRKTGTTGGTDGTNPY